MDAESASREELIAEIGRLRKAEEEHRLFRRIVQSSSDACRDPVWVMDRQGRFVFFNAAFSRIVASLYGVDMMSGMSLEEVISPEKFSPDYAYWSDLFSQALCGEAVIQDFSYVMENVIRYTVISCFPVCEGNLVFNGCDVTALREAEERILDAQELTEKLLEASTIGILIYDSSGICRSANSAAGAILGMDSSSITGVSLDALGAWQNSGVIPAAQEILSGGGGMRMAAKTVAGNGHPVWLECRLLPFISRGERHLLLLLNDITESRQIEEDTNRIMHELKKSNSELEIFAYVASHDLQEPLRVIASYLQLIERRYAERLDDKGKDFIFRTVNAAKRMQGMIEDLLQYSRVMTRGGAFEQIMLQEAYDDAVKNMRLALRESGAEISAAELPPVKADRSQMTRLFQNLISNAVKFRGKNRPVIRIGCVSEGSFWKISVADNGIGIQKEFCGRIFQIFQRLHTRDSYPGSGIGLAVCQRIVERHGGKIWAESVPEEGSVFYFILPKV